MLLRTLKFIQKHSLFNKESKILLAISGGMDSMALLHLLHKEEFNIAVAHVNYKLREIESDLDEQLVHQYCAQHNIIYHTISFDTKLYCKNNKIGTQEAARILRYDWFKDLSDNHNYEGIITAHHLNDNIETSIHHFARGSGLKGIRAMLPNQADIKRPFLDVSKDEIEKYVLTNDVPYREDSSNETRNYTRNKLRHDIIPVLDNIYPNFILSSKTTLSILRQTSSFYDEKMKIEIKSAVSSKGVDTHINKQKIINNKNGELILFEILHKFSFHPDTIHRIYKKLGDSAGQTFHTKNHHLTIEREHIVISPEKDQCDEITTIPEQGIYFNSYGELSIISNTDQNKVTDNQFQIMTNLTESDYPLELRKWRDGDRFKPKGMNGATKKVKKFLTDIKIPHRLKKQQLVLTNCQDEIIWVVGLRQDERFIKLTNEGKNVIIVWKEKLA